MAAPSANKRKVFFVKETPDSYVIDTSQLRPITRKQFDTILKLTATMSSRAAAKKVLGENSKPKASNKKK